MARVIDTLPDKNANELLRTIYNRLAKCNDQEMVKNERIAREFVVGFKTYLKTTENVDVNIFTQGSAYEGLKVGHPNEFDYLLGVNDTLENMEIQAIDARNLPHDNSEMMGGYYRLQVGKTNDYSVNMNGQPCLSIQKYKAKFQTAINSYVRGIKNGQYMQEIRSAKTPHPSIGEPAISAQVYKSGGSEIAIDMSICIRLQLGGKIRFFVAKRHPGCGELNTLWQHTCSQEEQAMVSIIPEPIKQNYCIVKYILKQKYRKNSYVIKSALLYLYHRHQNALPEDPSEFVQLMFQTLHSAFRNRSLKNCFDQNLDVMKNFNDQYVTDQAVFFDRVTWNDILYLK